jgi:hypothetical protein
LRAVEEAVASFGVASKPNIATENWQGVEGSPPISKRPAASVTVVILALLPTSPQTATTVAPGIAWPPEATDPLCVSPSASPANMKTSPA